MVQYDKYMMEDSLKNYSAWPGDLSIRGTYSRKRVNQIALRYFRRNTGLTARGYDDARKQGIL